MRSLGSQLPICLDFNCTKKSVQSLHEKGLSAHLQQTLPPPREKHLYRDAFIPISISSQNSSTSVSRQRVQTVFVISNTPCRAFPCGAPQPPARELRQPGARPRKDSLQPPLYSRTPPTPTTRSSHLTHSSAIELFYEKLSADLPANLNRGAGRYI